MKEIRHKKFEKMSLGPTNESYESYSFMEDFTTEKFIMSPRILSVERKCLGYLNRAFKLGLNFIQYLKFFNVHFVFYS
jgi:hypothetical protein